MVDDIKLEPPKAKKADPGLIEQMDGGTPQFT